MRAIGFTTCTMVGARVAGKDGKSGIRYIPAHTKNGKLINQRCIIPVYINTSRGQNPDGTTGKSYSFRLTAWNALADTCARNLPVGKAIDCITSPVTFQGPLTDNGIVQLKSDSTPIMITKVSFTIVESPVFGEEALKTIELEVNSGRRPVNWNNPAHPDAQIWTNMLKERQNVQYIPGQPMFGYAEVLVPSGQGIVLVNQAATGPLARDARNAARAGNVNTPVHNAQANTNPAGNNPIPPAINQEQLADLIAKVLVDQGGTNTPPAQGMDSKTGFPTGVVNTATGDDIPF